MLATFWRNNIEIWSKIYFEVRKFDFEQENLFLIFAQKILFFTKKLIFDQNLDR
mgnify:CR=1 FL=1